MTSVVVRLSTPVRELDLPVRDGCRQLGPEPAATDDPRDVLVHAMLAVAQDRGSLSDELHLAAANDRERHHLDRGRANLLRALDLPADAAVLEVGAECGALTRHLGETAALVDAVEAAPAAAGAARARTAGLGSVEVYLGTLAQLPAGPGYDVAVALGCDLDAELLREVRRRLRPGGVLVLAAANQLGVRAMTAATAAGVAPRALEHALADAGFTHRTVLGAFPDHLTTRLVVGPGLAEELPGLATALPPLEPAQRRLWARLVAGGDSAPHYADSLVVLAGTGPQRLWPAGRLAAYFNTDRSAGLCAMAEVRAPGTIRRAPLHGTGDAGRVRLHGYDEPVYDGPLLLDVIADQPERAVELLRGWRELVRAQWPRLGPRSWDLVPHNVVVTAEGLVPIDLEWEVDGLALPHVIGRGLLLTADHLAARGWAGAGAHTTVYELAGWLAVACGSELGQLDRAIDAEAWFQAVCRVGHTGSAALAAETRHMRQALTDRLTSTITMRSTDAGH